jgi:hypothetical protein
LKLEQNPALVYQGTPQRGDADYSARKKLYWNLKDFGIYSRFQMLENTDVSSSPKRDFEKALRFFLRLSNSRICNQCPK